MPFADSSFPPPEWAAGTPPSPDELRAARDRHTTSPAERRPRRSRVPSTPPPPPPDAAVEGVEPDAHDVARQIVLRQLTNAPKSRAQLEQVLTRKGCDAEVAAGVLDRMEEVGLVDDEAYAGMLVRSQQAGRGLARRALAQTLRQKGVSDEIAETVLEDVDPAVEEDRARELVEKRLRRLHGLDPLVQTRRLAGLLARKGYPSEVSMRVIREAIASADEHRRD